MRTWKGNRVRPDSPVIGRNADGSRRTLFWCLQGEKEHAALARHLGPEVPVYAMRSGHRILERYHEMLPALARRYASEIMEVDPIGPYLLGGNCQGGLIAFQTALELWRRGRRVELLLLLETMIDEPYPGRVALIYGRESQEENPYNAGPAPDPIFERNYRSYSVDIIPGNHGEFFRPPIVEGFTAALRRRTMEAESAWPTTWKADPAARRVVARCPPASEPADIQFLRPTITARRARSAAYVSPSQPIHDPEKDCACQRPHKPMLNHSSPPIRSAR